MSLSKGDWLSAGLYFKILRTFCNSPIETCQSLQRASLSLLTLQVPLDLLDHVAQVAEQLAQSLNLLQILLLVFFWTLLETSNFSGHLVNELELYTKMRTTLPLISKEAHQMLYLFLGCGRGQMQHLILPLRKDILTYPKPLKS